MASSLSPSIPLPDAVEHLLRDLCADRSLAPPDPGARSDLARLGAAAAVDVLQTIRSTPSDIRTLSGYIKHLSKRVLEADRPSPPSPSFASPLDTVALPTHCRGPAVVAEAHLAALGELEFRKAFLIFSYIGKSKLEDVITVETIRSINDLDMVSFEAAAWNAVGRQCIKESDRIKNIVWNSERSHVYHCHVECDGTTTFKGPFLQPTRTHLQRVLGDDNVLNVKFEEGSKAGSGAKSGFGNSSFSIYHNISRQGIHVGLRRYQFFVYKDGGKEEKQKSSNSSSVKCYFVCTGSRCTADSKNPILTAKSISEARCLFMHIHMVPTPVKYMPRFSLILSKTMKLEINLDSVDVKCIPDIPCMDDDECIVYDGKGDPTIHTDGTGFISEDLAMQCPENIFKGQKQRNVVFEGGMDETPVAKEIPSFKRPKFPPLLIQCRLFHKGSAVKGTLLVNKKLPPDTIHIRPSMIKVKTDPKLSNSRCANSLEIVKTSNEPKKTYLSKYLIALLHYGGVPCDFFLNLLTDALYELQNIRLNKKTAMHVATRHRNIGGLLVRDMILSGIPLDEPYLERRLSVFMNEDLKGLGGGKLPVNESYYLMGTADPTGTLMSNEVCVILKNGQISGDVLVYRNPGLHFGDVHILKATYIKSLEEYVGHSKYVIFFSTKGPRSVSDEIAGGDLDGDMYWVSSNPELLHYFKASQPWVCNSSQEREASSKPVSLTDVDFETQLFQQYLDYRFGPSGAVGIAADSWMSYMDRLLTLNDACNAEKECLRTKMLQLADIYYDALDAPKSGKQVEVPLHLKAERFPHYMGNKKNYQTYTSKSVLGLIFDRVAVTDEALPAKEVWKLPCFLEQPASAFMDLWRDHYRQYRSDMKVALALDREFSDHAATEVREKYKQILYGAADFHLTEKPKEKIFGEALAIYHVAYDYAKNNDDPGKCCFPWEVAASALTELHVVKKGQGSTIVCQSVLDELFG